MSAPHVLYQHYLTNLRTWGPSPLDDQNLGGVFMWVFGDVAFLLGMGLVVASWVRLEDRKTARLDARLDAERAERAARAERAERAARAGRPDAESAAAAAEPRNV
jgi:putative copper resistance protein D